MEASQLQWLIAFLLIYKVFSQCPEFYGRYPTQQCDSYIECIEGVPHQRYCPQGLYFKDKSGYPCVYEQEVDCAGKSIQPPNPSQECPNSFGLYPIGQPNDCGVYMNCVHGKSFIRNCPEGLAFNEQSLDCDWPDLVPNCNTEAYLGFQCPGTSDAFYSSGQCDKFFSCSTGRPRLHKCGKNKAFNYQINACDDSINVPGC